MRVRSVNIGDVGEGVEEEVKSRGGARKRWLRRRTMRTTENDGWVDGASLWEGSRQLGDEKGSGVDLGN
ncbi:hypothetical protein C1H46_002202 [Malus baccata]|uniref:Uncharacterized protein n=1 Tax=Malus baccata TaxID=106549 RepID=A0A540NM68_MALBA|nr:hypothetical protein C1H46_002202 [Malus baccata]